MMHLSTLAKRLILTGTALSTALVTLPAAAAEPGVEEIVVTATRVPTPLSRIPASVSVVTADEIDRNAWTTLPDALRTLPGLTLVRSGGPGAQSSVFLRGTESDHVLVLLDGQPLNDPSAAAGAFNFGDDLLGGLRRIEVVRGPASTLYGSNAIGGVINLITAAGADAPAVALVDVGIGTDETWRGTVGARGTVGRLDYGMTVQAFSTDGDNATPDRLAGAGGEADGFDNTTATAKAVYRLDGGALEALVRWRTAEFDLDDVPNDDPTYQGRSDQFVWQSAGEVELFGKQLTSRLAVGQTFVDRSFDNAPDADSVAIADDAYESVRTRADWQNSWYLHGAPALRDAIFTFGGTWTREEVEQSTLSDIGFGPFTQSVDADADTAALFAQAQARVLGRVDLTAGLRWDAPEDYGNRLTWRVGANLAVPELSSRLHAAIGTAFKAPTLFDRYGIDNFGFVGNPDLRPEESLGWEAGLETDLPALGRADFATLSATWFSNDVEDLITTIYNPDFSSSVANIDEAETEGLEIALILRPADWAELRASWTWTDARDGRTDARLLRRPENTGSLAATLRPLAGLTVAPELIFVGQRLDVVYGDDGSFLGTQGVGGYWQADLAVSYAVTDAVTAYLRAENLADREIEDPNGFARPDRGVLAGVRASF